MCQHRDRAQMVHTGQSMRLIRVGAGTCAGYLVHPFRKKCFEKRETKEKRGGNVKRGQAWSLGKDAVLRCASVPGLVCEGLETEPAWEQSLRMFLTHAAGRHLCEGWRLVCAQISL
jgi:hypothetical protein